MPNYGEIEYDDRGYPICHICGKAFKKLMSHATQKHSLTALEYKKEFGLDVSKGIMCKESTELARNRALDNYNVVIKKNLIEKGAATRYANGSAGRTIDKVSPQTMIRLRKYGSKLGKDK